MKKCIAIAALVFLSVPALAQFSIATDINVMRQFGKQQSFWSMAQTVQFSYALKNKESIYLSIGNSTPHDIKDNFITKAKSDTIFPKAIGYVATSSWRTRQFTAGWKHYFTGGYNSEDGLSIYGLAGAGIMSVKISTQFSLGVDTTHYYALTPLAGTQSVNRLSFDVGLGIEKPIMGNFFWYAEAKTWIHKGAFRSPLLARQNEKITPVMIGGGLRILFGYE